MAETGNDAQVRTVAEQLFDVWQSRQEAEQKLRSRWVGSAPAWIACVLSVIAVFWQAGVTTQSISDTIRRVDGIEAYLREKDREDKLTMQQLARIEAKVDLAIGDRRGGK